MLLKATYFESGKKKNPVINEKNFKHIKLKLSELYIYIYMYAYTHILTYTT